MRNLLELRGTKVFTRDERVCLGIVTTLFVDQGVGRIVAISFREGQSSPELWCDTSAVITADPEEITISSASKAQINGDTPGRDLAVYRRRGVFTFAGEHLGRLSDVETEGDNWGINRLHLESGSSLTIDGTELVLGRDEILVPNEFSNRIIPKIQLRFLSRVGRFLRALVGRAETPG